MKWLPKFLFITILLIVTHFTNAQKVVRKTDEKTKPPIVENKKDLEKKKEEKKPIEKKKEEKPTSFATLVLYANKGSAVSYTINDGEFKGKIKADGNTTKLPLKNGKEYKISLDDNQGTPISDTTIEVTESDEFKQFEFRFPEVDYAAIKNEIKQEKEAAAAILKEQKAEDIRLKKEAEDALSLLRIQALTETEAELILQIDKCKSIKDEMEQMMENILYGRKEYDIEISSLYSSFSSEKDKFKDIKKAYIDSSIAYNLRTQSSDFEKRIKTNEDNLKENVGAYIAGVDAGKRAASANAKIAFEKSRINDLKVIIPKDSMEIKTFEGLKPLFYALKIGSNISVFEYLIANGADVNYFKESYVATAPRIYKTILSEACVKGDMELIQLLINDSARFYTKVIPKTQREEHVKYFKKTLNFTEAVIAKLKEFNYDMDDGIEIKIKTIQQIIDSSLVFVPKGIFVMGCISEKTSTDCPGGTTAIPPITVLVDSFYMCKYEITQQQWNYIMEENPSYHVKENPAVNENCLDCPVENITYQDVQKFIQKVNAIAVSQSITNRKFRLPTEAEWEFAAKGGDSATQNYFAYAGSNNLDSVGWTSSNSGGKTHSVGKLMPNQLGIYDMTGNVSEWCSDWYDPAYYESVKSKGDSINININGPSTGVCKVMRGNNVRGGIRTSNIIMRELLYGGMKSYDYSSGFNGFRLVLEARKPEN